MSRPQVHTQIRPIPKTLPWFIWHFLRPFRWNLLGMLVPMIYSAFHLSLEPYVLKLLIDRVAQYTGDPSRLIPELQGLMAAFVGVAVILVLGWRTKDYFAMKTLPAMKSAIIGELFDYINHHSFKYYQENFAGNLANKIKEVSTGIEDLIENIREVFRQSIVVIIAALMTLTVSSRLSLILLAWAVLFVGIGMALSKDIIARSEKFAESRSVAFGKIVDSISNHNNVRLFGRNHFERRFLQRYLNQIQTEDIQLRLKFMLLWGVQGLLACTMLGLMLYSLLSLRAQGLVSVGDFAFVMWVSVALIDQVWLLTETLSKMPQHMGVCSQGLSLIIPHHEIVDEAEAPRLLIQKGQIQFKDVTFSHTKGVPFYRQLNLQIEPGSKVGLVGYSGSGKSTFAHLLVRLFDLDGGTISLDGQNIAKVSQQSLREGVSFIPQDPSLFHRSLMENIRYGNPQASDDEVIAAAKQAHAHEFILQTPEGYASMVGERGIKLSGGQRQRISIARAILKNAPILVLDEATSALDSVTESLIQDSLHELMKAKTALVIAHRLSTLLEMDRILVFDEGQILEDGTHQELIEAKGLYAKLWDSQVGGFLPETNRNENENGSRNENRK